MPSRAVARSKERSATVDRVLTFNQVLERAGLNPERVRLVRHRDPDHRKHRLVYETAMNADVRFDEYQDIQGTSQVIDAFRSSEQLASFVVEPGTKATVFVGVWDRLGERVVPASDPLGFAWTPRPGTVAFTTQRRHELDEYRGRLVIEWGDGARAWVQRADKQDKPILELRRVREEPQFPGFTQLRIPLADVEATPLSWAEVLRNARGIYLLVHRDSGDQYVGSAYGEGGFLARWKCYADGHGGNVAMKELGAAAEAYDAAILEVVGSDATADEIFARETLWKIKLGTRAKGLNRN